jgi:predicted PurR-regulated permease PerM
LPTPRAARTNRQGATDGVRALGVSSGPGVSALPQNRTDNRVPSVDSERPFPVAADAYRLARIVLMLAFGYGCLRVLSPFVPAVLFAIAIAVSLWPLQKWMVEHLGRRQVLASLVTCIVVALLVIAPVALLVVSLDEALKAGLAGFDAMVESSRAGPPAWLIKLPWLGGYLEQLWNAAATSDGAWIAQWASPARSWLLAFGKALGNGLGQIALGALLLFALFRHGERLATVLVQLTDRAGGSFAVELLVVARRAVVGVLIGVVGTASAQSVVAMIGFLIAGVPNPLLLGALTFVLSLVPIGPPLVWGAATIWLAQHGEVGRAVFMGLYGLLGISAVDNVVKPLLISRTSHLPLVLTLIGVFGGVIAFGVAGIFVGPALLAVAAAVVDTVAERGPPPGPAGRREQV